jgi:hypothetical protein
LRTGFNNSPSCAENQPVKISLHDFFLQCKSQIPHQLMKYLLLPITAVLFLFACKNDPAPGTSGTPVTPNGGEPALPITETKMVIDSVTGKVYEVQRPVNAISTAISETPSATKDAVAPHPGPPDASTPQGQRIVNALTQDYWVIWALSRIGYKANRPHQGTWFKFHPDGSYEYGHFSQTIGKGAWSWRYEGEKAYLLLDSELLGDDREWSFLMGSDEEVMIWVGTERYHTNDIQCKLQKLMFIPKNRGEMGYEDEKNAGK